jgi:2-polyprenyl-3-methyl-5-hydroxy-6-metoxy-1,4-benzoquinol methylase
MDAKRIGTNHIPSHLFASNDSEEKGSSRDTTKRYGEFYNAKLAASQRRQYRENGPNPWTATLIEALKSEGVEGATLLDIGGGIGAIQHELLAAGVASVVVVDASEAYIEAAREESDRRGHSGRIKYVHGDFVEVADSIPQADIVTLDRVINVYPNWERLVSLSAAHARRLYGFVYPRETRGVRSIFFAMNVALRLRGTHVRCFIHPLDGIDRVLRERGLTRQFVRSVRTPWDVAVYRRV